jgi:hypothetical protein
MRREERCVQGFGGKSDGKRYLKDTGADERIKLRWNFRK